MAPDDPKIAEAGEVVPERQQSDGKIAETSDERKLAQDKFAWEQACAKEEHRLQQERFTWEQEQGKIERSLTRRHGPFLASLLTTVVALVSVLTSWLTNREAAAA